MLSDEMSTYMYLIRFDLGVVQKLRRQNEAGRWSNNTYFCQPLL